MVNELKLSSTYKQTKPRRTVANNETKRTQTSAVEGRRKGERNERKASCRSCNFVLLLLLAVLVDVITKLNFHRIRWQRNLLTFFSFIYFFSSWLKYLIAKNCSSYCVCVCVFLLLLNITSYTTAAVPFPFYLFFKFLTVFFSLLYSDNYYFVASFHFFVCSVYVVFFSVYSF